MKKRIKKHITDLLKDESGQGTTEYILILVGVVAIALLAGPRIKGMVGDMLNTNLATKISDFMTSI